MHPLCVLSEQNVKTIVTVKDNFDKEEKAGSDFVIHQAQPLPPELSPGLLGWARLWSVWGQVKY